MAQSDSKGSPAAVSVKAPVEETPSASPPSPQVDSAAPKLPDRYADESYKLFSKIHVEPPTPDEARKIRNKCIRRILPFLCVGYHLMYVDKQTLGNSSILGILKDANLNSTQYNWLSSIFYLGYLLAEWPQNWALQRFPVAKWMAGNLMVWGCILLLHIPCSNFASLFVVRFLLGLAEACIVPAFLLTLSMFFTYDEQAVLMPIMWAVGNSSPITSGLLSYGVLWIDTQGFSPWRWFFVITGGLTVAYGLAVWFLFPDSPITASFLATPEERAQAILRIASNHSGIEQKRFKRHQFAEAVRDPKTWLFFLHAWSQEMANGLTNQYSLIIRSFGFTTLQTTLLGCVGGVVALASLAAAAAFLWWRPAGSRAYVSAASYVPAIASGVMLVSMPWGGSSRGPLLAAIWMRSTAGVAYSVAMVWAANCSAGHTKKTTVIGLYHVGYGLGNILSPQLFQPQYAPRYVVTWAVLLGIAGVLPMGIVLYLRWYLARENARRDRLQSPGGGGGGSGDKTTTTTTTTTTTPATWGRWWGRKNVVMDGGPASSAAAASSPSAAALAGGLAARELGIVEHVDDEGRRTEAVVDARQLDLTDRENLSFRYVL